ncbi:MAG: hypothetical protein GY851_08070 [bacterium]|nr:hypothetical protein [bacterium]
MRKGFAMLLLLVGAMAAAAAEDANPFQTLGDNLLSNGGFEAPSDSGVPEAWAGNAAVYQQSTAIRRRGAASLAYANDDPAAYVLCTQNVTLQPGRIYLFGVTVRAKDVTGDDTGASVCMEWYDKDGGYLGGRYPTGVKGSTGWTKLQGVTPRIPDGAVQCRFCCYLRKGMTGSAWWDEARLLLVREDPLQTIMDYPRYRGELPGTGPGTVRIRADLNLTDYAFGPERCAVRWQLRPEKRSAVLAEGSVLDLAGGQATIRIPARDPKARTQPLPAGRYTVELTLVDTTTGDTLDTADHTFTQLPKGVARKVSVDRHNRLIVDGEPFFPLGMYWMDVTEADLDVFADSAFNCLMPYRMPNKDQMGWAAARDLKVIYSLKDCYAGSRWASEGIEREADERPFMAECIRRFRDHPALLAWYINDELPLGMLPRLTAHRAWLEELDPDHPTWVVLWQVDEVAAYLPSYDIIGTDPYPINRAAPSRAAEWTRKTVDGVRGLRAVWQVPQAHNLGIYEEKDRDAFRPPTYKEMRSMTWQCIAEGANGIVLYSWFDLKRDPAAPFEARWNDVRAVAAEVGEYIPVLLSTEPAPAVAVSETPGLHARVQREGKATYLFVVNSLEKTVRGAIEFPSKPSTIERLDTGEEIAPVPQTRLVLSFAPLEVRVYRFTGF